MSNEINRTGARKPLTILLAFLGIGVLLVLLMSISSRFFYFFEQVAQDEVGIQFESGRITNIVGPGVYSAAGLFVDLQRVSSKAVPFEVQDAELITKDKQRIGLTVTGDIFRPILADAEQLRGLWAKYNQLFVNDEAARQQVMARAKQAMKVCVGDRNFDDAVIGTGRDVLRDCIDVELGELSADFGLAIDNVAVPEVTLSPEVQAGLDRIVQLRLETEQARQDELKASAQAEAEQARQEGEIRVAQSRIQEEARQQLILAQLNEEKIMAQKAVIEAERANELARVEAERAIIEAEKANELIAAQRDLEIQRAAALAAAEQAKADTAIEAALATILASNPGLLQLKTVEANAQALQPTDKLIFTPDGTTPTIVLPGPGIVPTVNTGGATGATTDGTTSTATAGATGPTQP
jgi:regulator of protease activity HflC (stomatin/prohibitin superfamily)